VPRAREPQSRPHASHQPQSVQSAPKQNPAKAGGKPAAKEQGAGKAKGKGKP
jgi:hypothetical protein